MYEITINQRIYIMSNHCNDRSIKTADKKVRRGLRVTVTSHRPEDNTITAVDSVIFID